MAINADIQIIDTVYELEGATIKTTLVIDNKFPGTYQVVCDDDDNKGIIRLMVVSNNKENSLNAYRESIEIAAQAAEEWNWAQQPLYKWAKNKTK